MKGLLLKDAYQTWCYTRWIILVSVAMMLMGTFFMKEGSNFFMLYGGLLLGMSPMTFWLTIRTAGSALTAPPCR